jgi:cobalt-zinc-cadmium efflux system outer membrane protein
MKHRSDNQKAITSLFALIFLILLLPSCAPSPSSINPNRRYKIVSEETKKHTNIDIDWQDIEAGCGDVSQEIADMLERGISRSDAVKIALLNNHALHADFESLGISRADLAQAGLYTNPSSDSIFVFPTNFPDIQPVVTFGVTFSVSDLWRVPLREKVAYDELEITTARILQTIIDTVAEAKTAYDTHMYQQILYATQKSIIVNSNRIRDMIYKNKLYPKTTAADHALADALSLQSELDLTNVDTNRNIAFINLRNILGLKPEPKPLKLTSNFVLPHYRLPAEDSLNKIALNNNPQIQMAKLKIQQATDSLKYERASVVQRFDAGFQYIRDTDGLTKYFGPEIVFDIPIFDNNSAQIARAKATLEQAKREYIDAVNQVINDVQQAFQIASGYDEIIELTKKIVKANEQAMLFTDQHPSILELNVVNALQIRTNLYAAEKNLLLIQFEALTSRNELERILGKSLELVPLEKEKSD